MIPDYYVEPTFEEPWQLACRLLREVESERNPLVALAAYLQVLDLPEATSSSELAQALLVYRGICSTVELFSYERLVASARDLAMLILSFHGEPSA